MATHVATSTRIYAGHLDLSVASSVDFGTLTAARVSFSNFNSGGYEEYKPGLKSGTFTLQPFADFAAGAIDAELATAGMGVQYPISVDPCPTGTATAGDTAWFSRGILTKRKPWEGAVGAAAMAPLEFAYDTAFVQGKVAHPLASRTATGNGTTIALTGPTTSQRLYCALHVTAWSGLTSLVVTVQSDDNSGMTSATTQMTMATATGTTSEFKSVAGYGATETHHRVVYTIVGTGSCSFTANIGVL